jgi:hypothetical protein
MMDKSPQDPGLNLDTLAVELFEWLARRFPICMASDEFHFFPQARAAVHDWSRWDDYSPEGIADTIDGLTQGALSLGRLRQAQPGFDEGVEIHMLERLIATLSEQLSEVAVYLRQPTYYLTMVGIGLAEAFDAGGQALVQRIRGLPLFLTQARRNLRQIPSLFRDLGLEMLQTLSPWVQTLPVDADLLTQAMAAMDRLAAHLKRIAIEEDFLPSPDLYQRIAVTHMGCDQQPEELARLLKHEMDHTRAMLSRCAELLAPGQTWQQVLAGWPVPPLQDGGLIALYQQIVFDLSDHCLAGGMANSDLVEKCPVAVEGIPDYMLPVRSGAAYSMEPVSPPVGGTFFILPGSNPAVPPDYRLLAAHETYPGHHLLDTRRWSLPKPVRRHIEFPLFYEGWASFSEELLFETGFFQGPKDQFLMAKRRFWRAVRGMTDLNIHTRRRTPDQAVGDLVSEGMPPAVANAMVRRYVLKPGYQLAYTPGRYRFHQLYESFDDGPVAFARQILDQGELGFKDLKKVLF